MIPLLFLTLLVLLAAVSRERRRRTAFLADDGAFACRVRAVRGPSPTPRRTWSASRGLLSRLLSTPRGFLSRLFPAPRGPLSRLSSTPRGPLSRLSSTPRGLLARLFSVPRGHLSVSRRRRRLRLAGPRTWRLLRRRWSRRMWARWCGDVLEIRRGPVLDRTVRLAGRVSPVGVYTVPPRDARRCGAAPIAVRLLVGDGSIVEVTATEAERTELVGPFLAAAFSDLPTAPARRRDTRKD